MGKMPRIIKTGPPAKRPGGLVPTQRAGRRYETWLWHGEGERARKSLRTSRSPMDYCTEPLRFWPCSRVPSRMTTRHISSWGTGAGRSTASAALNPSWGGGSLPVLSFTPLWIPPQSGSPVACICNLALSESKSQSCTNCADTSQAVQGIQRDIPAKRGLGTRRFPAWSLGESTRQSAMISVAEPGALFWHESFLIATPRGEARASQPRQLAP